MQLTLTTDYAMRLVFYLAEKNERCNAALLSEKLGIPPSYVPKVTKLLKQAGILKAVEGSQGGYRLAKPLHDISMLDILSCTEKSIKIDRSLEYGGETASALMPQLRRSYEQLQRELEEQFGRTTIADLMEPVDHLVRTYLMNVAVDVDSDAYMIQYIHDDSISEVLPATGKYSRLIEDYTTGFVHPDDRERVAAFMKMGAETRFEQETYIKENIRYRRNTAAGYIWMEMILLTGWARGVQTLLLTIHNAAAAQLELNAMEQVITQNSYELQRSYLDFIAMFQFILDCVAPEGKHHSEGVVHRTGELLRVLGQRYPETALPEGEIHAVSSLAALHDIGKLTIPREILAKPEPLTPEERKIVQTHTVNGAELVRKIPTLTDTPKWSVYVYNICRYHHERYDGQGYPDGLRGEEIPLCAQVVSIVDCYDALVNERTYHSPYSHEEAVAMILRGECGAFSPRIKDSFLAASQKPSWPLHPDKP